MSAVRFTILGPVRAWRDDADLDLGGRQQRLVLALLLARTGTVVSVSELIDAVWENEPPPSAVNVVHRYIGTLRRLIEPDLPVRATGEYLIRHAAGYRLRVDADTLDLVRFRRLVQDARRASDPDAAVKYYAGALALWRGLCAAGLEPISRTHPVLVAIEAERAQVLRDAADAALNLGQVRLVIPALRQAVGWTPLDEPLQARLIAALAADGRQAEAVEAYQEVRRRLSAELGIPPGRELSEAYDRLLHQRPSAPIAEPAPAPPVEEPATPAQLPPDHPFFTGRDDVLARAATIVEHDRALGRPTVTLAVDGMPGIGKTTLAVHLGHQLADAHPDGQLYADLRGFSARGPAMNPEEALRGFLGSLGVAQEMIPTELHALAGLYRSIIAGRSVLVVLDNARDFEQVRHLLPPGPDSSAIVTSRVRITGLVTVAGAHPMPLELPAAPEARQILTRRIGRGRGAVHPAAADEIIRRCGRLPLAVALVAARAVARPDSPLTDIAAELSLDGNGLDGFGMDPTTGLAAVFSWSYRALSPAAARLLRLLPVHPGATVSTAAAASLAAVDLRAAKALLGELATYMFTQEQSGRHRVHELIRTFAEDLSLRHDHPEDRRAALDRMLEHYRAGSYAAHLRLDPALAAPAPPPARPGVLVPDIADREEAMAWFTDRHRVLADVVALADAHDAHDIAWHVALTAQNFLHFTGRIRDWAAISRRGLAAARTDVALDGQAHLHRSLAGAMFLSDDPAGAARQLNLADDLMRRTGDRHGRAVVALNRAYLQADEHRHADAVRHGEQALALFRAADDTQNQARALRVMAGSLAMLGQHQDALDLLRETLAMSWAAGDAVGAGHSWDLLGQTYQDMGHRQESIDHWEQAAQTYRRAGVPAALGDVLLILGDTYRLDGDEPAARRRWAEALSRLPDQGGPLADELHDRLGSGPRRPDRLLPGLAALSPTPPEKIMKCVNDDIATFRADRGDVGGPEAGRPAAGPSRPRGRVNSG
ncbi:AfsR/SARP family transcriptional regulator [Paractinoplanes hotanensis]|uniref:Tetratricopeptide repeat protein n=1 Tax=Paractinoplanes hotanensis TaxID=2906497 RepID=A0ABT0YAI0_9ACTN|nr:BTAD domain-containing putative transcriptional regulator [Actinoplanes hotanensis]MCM4082309.1 tetratricopeptide repeat protein [Actinoplanes hotanensis]